MAAMQATGLSDKASVTALAVQRPDAGTTASGGPLNAGSAALPTRRQAQELGTSNIAQLLRQHRVLIGAAVLLIVLGLVFGQEWLTAASVLPLVISALPCVAMCALGLCMRGQGGQACGSQSTPQADSGAKLNTGETEF